MNKLKKVFYKTLLMYYKNQLEISTEELSNIELTMKDQNRVYDERRLERLNLFRDMKESSILKYNTKILNVKSILCVLENANNENRREL